MLGKEMDPQKRFAQEFRKFKEIFDAPSTSQASTFHFWMQNCGLGNVDVKWSARTESCSFGGVKSVFLKSKV